jgi:hypothetical protein
MLLLCGICNLSGYAFADEGDEEDQNEASSDTDEDADESGGGKGGDSPHGNTDMDTDADADENQKKTVDRQQRVRNLVNKHLNLSSARKAKSPLAKMSDPSVAHELAEMKKLVAHLSEKLGEGKSSKNKNLHGSQNTGKSESKTPNGGRKRSSRGLKPYRHGKLSRWKEKIYGRRNNAGGQGIYTVKQVRRLPTSNLWLEQCSPNFSGKSYGSKSLKADLPGSIYNYDVKSYGNGLQDAKLATQIKYEVKSYDDLTPEESNFSRQKLTTKSQNVAAHSSYFHEKSRCSFSTGCS